MHMYCVLSVRHRRPTSLFSNLVRRILRRSGSIRLLFTTTCARPLTAAAHRAVPQWTPGCCHLRRIWLLLRRPVHLARRLLPRRQGKLQVLGGEREIESDALTDARTYMYHVLSVQHHRSTSLSSNFVRGILRRRRRHTIQVLFFMR